MKILIIGDYKPNYPPHPATTDALTHVALKKYLDIEIQWLPTQHLVKFEILFDEVNAIWLGPAPYLNLEGVRHAVQYIRKHNIPFIGTCGGMYQAISEFAINVLGLPEHNIEITLGEKKNSLFIRDESCSVHGFKTINFKTVEGTKTHSIYHSKRCIEESNCGFAVNQIYHSAFESLGFKIAGIDIENEAKIFELQNNKFYIVTKFLPQIQSSNEIPHPLIEAFVMAGIEDYNSF